MKQAMGYRFNNYMNGLSTEIAVGLVGVKLTTRIEPAVIQTDLLPFVGQIPMKFNLLEFKSL